MYRVTYQESVKTDGYKREFCEEYSSLDIKGVIDIISGYMNREFKPNTDYEIIWWNDEGNIEHMFNGSVECGWY